MALVPIEHELAVEAFLNDVPIQGQHDGRLPRVGNFHDGLRQISPAGAGQAVLRRMDRVALPLALPVADVEIHAAAGFR